MAGVGKIAWLCDCKGWAFENRAKAISKLLPDYEHEIRVLKTEESFNFDDFDIVVCDFLPWINFIGEDDKPKLILGLRSFRALKIYEGMVKNANA